MAGGTVNGIGVYSIPTGVVAVSVFDGVDGIAAALVDVAVVAIYTTIMKISGAGLDDSIVRETCTIVAVTAEAETCVCKCENGFGEGTVVDTATVVAGALGTAGIGARVVGTVV